MTSGATEIPPGYVCNATYETGKQKVRMRSFCGSSTATPFAAELLFNLSASPKETRAAPQSPKLPQNSLYCDGMVSNIKTL